MLARFDSAAIGLGAKQQQHSKQRKTDPGNHRKRSANASITVALLSEV